MVYEDPSDRWEYCTGCTLSVLWQDRKGNIRSVEAAGVMSLSGARIESEEPIYTRSSVFFDAEQYNLIGSARVCSCKPLRAGFLIELEFLETAMRPV